VGRGEGVGPDEREELFERAKALAADRETWPEADRLWIRVISSYREAIEGAVRADRNDERQLARAQWRHASLLAVLGRAVEAAQTGREAVASFARVHDAVSAEEADPMTPRRDQALGERLIATVDLAGFELGAGSSGLRLDLLRQAAELGMGQVGNPLTAGPHTREAMGFVYHHFAVALLDHGRDRDDLVQASLMASLATDIRQADLQPAHPGSVRSLAATCVTFARCLVRMGDEERLAGVVRLAEDLMASLGPAADDLRAQLRAVVPPTEIPPLPDIMPLRLSAQPPRRRWWQRRP
jgi:hypothetical protein